jgi:hypothetical protein
MTITVLAFLLRAGFEVPDPVPFKAKSFSCREILYTAQTDGDKYTQIVTKSNTFYLTNYENLDILGQDIRKACQN